MSSEYTSATYDTRVGVGLVERRVHRGERVGTPFKDSNVGYDPSIVHRHPPADVGTIYGHSQGLDPNEPPQSRPGWAGAVSRNRDGRGNIQTDRIPNQRNDVLIQRQRAYLFRRAYYIPAGDGGGNKSWVADGPIKDMPTTRFLKTLRPLVGGGHRDMWGQHTDLTTARLNQLEGRATMQPRRQNRLTVQRYRGQSYSQTTKLAGA